MAAEQQTGHGKQLVSFVVARHLVKDVKTALQKRERYASSRKIRPYLETDGGLLKHVEKYIVASTFDHEEESHLASRFVDEEGILSQDAIIVERDTPGQFVTTVSAMETAVLEWLAGSHEGTSDIVKAKAEILVPEIPKTYTIYGPMLLLPQHAFQSEAWRNVLDLQSTYEGRHRDLFEAISKNMKVRHIAINAPIPLQNTQTEESDGGDELNILRSPTNLVPLYGDFGPMCDSVTPSKADFSAAFWCHTRQNGITQIWAPRYTMFSRRNITEKARVLKMPSVASAISQSPQTGCCAVDLYTGIGYFTFSYLSAGVKMVLGWDLNPWSIEGLRQGAVANKWDAQVYSTETKTEDIYFTDQTRLLAFVEGNELAFARITKLRHALPPVRHINCGLLPTSRGSYATAAAALDPDLGGWIHVHENFGVAEIKEKAEDVRQCFQQLMYDLDTKTRTPLVARRVERQVVIEHVQRVKSYAPGVFHCVVDVFVPPAV